MIHDLHRRVYAAVFILALGATQVSAVAVADKDTWLGGNRGMFAGATYKDFPIVSLPFCEPLL
jgi:hypothetical protein